MPSEIAPTTRIVRFHELGGPEVLRIDEVPLPEPGPGEVRLRVKAIGLNRAEVLFRQGRYLAVPKFPSVLGYEASGMVEAIGEGVDGSWLGKTASTVPAFPPDRYGVYGEVAIVPASALAEYPANLSFEEGTSIWMQYLTAYGALVMHGQIAKGDFVLITAASSSVGLAAIEIAKAEGAFSVATTRTSRKTAELLAAGADYVIAMDEGNLPARVQEISGGKGARIVFDPIAGKGVEALAEAAAPGGTIFLYGGLSADPAPLPLYPMLRKHLVMRGYTLCELNTNPEWFARSKQYVFDRLASGEFKPRIDSTFPLERIVEAHRYMESNQQVGKIVVTV